ncbi:hypothetical protein BGX38DRAFT_487219 [Terfezia claveryi]|nr:hypothetical protein BGX38DRAFT_487219 [Terfezia claveryi]
MWEKSPSAAPNWQLKKGRPFLALSKVQFGHSTILPNRSNYGPYFPSSPYKISAWLAIVPRSCLGHRAACLCIYLYRWRPPLFSFFSSFLTLRSSHSATNQQDISLRISTLVMAVNRSAGRDIHIYDAKDPDTVLRGLVLTNGITNANFYSMMEVFLLFGSEYVLQHEDGMVVTRDEQVLGRGKYYIVT